MKEMNLRRTMKEMKEEVLQLNKKPLSQI